MKKRILWILMSGLMALSLVMAACGPAEVEKEEVEAEADMVKVTLKKLDGTTITKMVERPKYGGTYTLPSGDVGNFDAALSAGPRHTLLSYSVLLGGDPEKGPSGTNEISWYTGNLMGYGGLLRNELAESYEMPDDETIRFKIRKGVHFALNPNMEASRLVNGREMTAEDVAYSIERIWDSPSSYHSRNFPKEKLIAATAIDKYTLDLKVPPGVQGMHILQTAGRINVVAREVVEKYGELTDWENAVGTGPFMLTDVTPGDSRTYLRNPNYFEMDPWFPENRLPYIDYYKVVVIPDRSTKLAALRTAKIDSTNHMSGLTWEESAIFKKDYPDILQTRTVYAPYSLTGRLDKPELPWAPLEDPNAIKVRRALNMAVDKQKIIDTYYGGQADLFAVPWTPWPEFEGVFEPLNTFSEEVQELFTYNPDKAKQLLTEAGYPDGFTAVVTTTAGDADFLAILKDYFSKVGVELELDVRETGVIRKVKRERTYPEMVYDVVMEPYQPFKMHGVREESRWNFSLFEHPDTRAAYNELQLYLVKDEAKCREIYKSITELYLESAWGVWMPLPYHFPAWWPWLKRFDGATNIGVFRPDTGHQYWVWIDQDLRKKMGH